MCICGWLSKLWLFWGTLHIKCRIIIGSKKGTIILTTTHMVYTWALKLLRRNPFTAQVYKGSEEILIVFL